MKFTVISSANIPAPDLARAGKLDVLVIYSTAEGRTDSVHLPAEDFDLEKLDAAVAANERLHGGLRGITREV